MRLLQRTSLVLALLSASTFHHAAHAQSQVAVYGEFGVSNYGYSTSYQSINFSPDRPSFTFGAMDNFTLAQHFALGADVRGSFAPTSVGGDKVYISARASFLPASGHYDLYLQIGGGVIQAKAPGYGTIGAQTFSKGAVDFAIGYDHRLTSALDWRVIEIESGAGVSKGTSVGSATIGTGLIYAFHRSEP